MVICTVGNHLLGRTALRTDPGHKEEIVRTERPDLGQFVSLGSTHHKHHVVRSGNRHHLLHHSLIQRFSVLFGHLELRCRSIRSQRKDYRPFVLICKERGDAVSAHIRSQGNCIEIHGLEKRLGIHLCRIPNITSLGISDDENLRIAGPDIIHRDFKGTHAVQSVTLIKSQIRLVCHAIWGSRINNCLVEFDNGACFPLEKLSHSRHFTFKCLSLDMFRHLVEISIETDTQYSALLFYLGI